MVPQNELNSKAFQLMLRHLTPLVGCVVLHVSHPISDAMGGWLARPRKCVARWVPSIVVPQQLAKCCARFVAAMSIGMCWICKTAALSTRTVSVVLYCCIDWVCNCRLRNLSLAATIRVSDSHTIEWGITLQPAKMVPIEPSNLFEQWHSWTWWTMALFDQWHSGKSMSQHGGFLKQQLVTDFGSP